MMTGDLRLSSPSFVPIGWDWSWVVLGETVRRRTLLKEVVLGQDLYIANHPMSVLVVDICDLHRPAPANLHTNARVCRNRTCKRCES